MELSEVLEVLDALDSVGVAFWIGGGWGVDALAHKQTRVHRDLDLLVDTVQLDACVSALGELGYEIETDWMPLRIELAASGNRWVDVHPARFEPDGHALQGERDGVHFDYPPVAFTHGRIGDREVPCLSIDQQIAFHTGYEPRPQDEHDLRALRSMERDGAID